MGEEGRVSLPPDLPPPAYELAFLTDQWEWEQLLGPGSFEAAKAAAKRALEELVKSEAPELACVTLKASDGRRLGVWDWVAGEAHWSPL